VLLRDLRKLTDDEVTGWGRQITVTVYYYQYSDVTLAVGFGPDSIPKIDTQVLREELRSHPILQSVFNDAAEQLDTLKLLARDDKRTVRFRIVVQPEMLYLSGEAVIEIALEGKARLVAQPIVSPEVFGYGQPTESATEREATVERFALGETSIVHEGGRIAVEIDLSALQLPPLSQVRFFRILAAEEVEHESFALTHPQKLRVSGRFTVELYALLP
jgi:hypothetical protein